MESPPGPNYTSGRHDALDLRLLAGAASMPKALCILGMVVSILLILLFGMDMAMGFPFRGVGIVWSILFVAGAGVLAFLSWSTFRKMV